MRQTLTALTIHVFFATCNNPEKVQTTIQHQTEQSTDSTKINRKLLVEGIKDLQQILASNEKEKIAEIFQFPFSAQDIDIFMDDTAFNGQLKLAGNKVNKEIFLQNFNAIKNGIWLNQLDSLLRHLTLDSLLLIDTLEYNDYAISKPCYYSYKLIIDNEYILVIMSSNSNEYYKDENVLMDHVPENSSEVCEHSCYWTLRLNSQKPVVEKISGAG